MKIKSFFSRNYFLIVAIILFVLPFFWFKPGEVDTGGDSSRLYFIDPFTWLKNIALYTINSLNSFNIDNPNFHLIPFLLLLIGLKHLLGGNAYLVNCAFSGLLLSGSFVFTFLSIKEIITENEDKKNNLFALLGGLFFVFSPLIIDGWMKSLYGFNQILVYPAVFFLFLKYIKSKNIRYIYLNVLFCLLFSVNFSFSTSPWFFSFFSFSIIFLFFFSSIIGNTKFFLKGILIFFVPFLLTQSFHLLSQFINIFDFSNPNSRAIFSKELMENRGLAYFNSLQPYARLLYNFLGQSQLHLPQGVGSFDFGLKQRYLYYLYIVLIVLGGVFVGKKGTYYQRRVYVLLMFIFLVAAFFMSANVTRYLAEFYKTLFIIPGFAMFRSFYSKFGMVYGFYYAILIALSLKLIFSLIKTNFVKVIVVIFLLFLIIFNGWPLISGMIVNTEIWQSKGVKLPSIMNKDYLSFLEKARKDKIEGRYLTIPLTNEEYQILGGEKGGAYFGPSILSVLGGKNDFVGFNSFGVFRKEIFDGFEKQDIELLKRYFSVLNIRYIFHNSDEYIYQNFPSYPYPTMFKKVFPSNKEMEDFIKKLGYEKIETIGNYFSTFKNKTGFLPRFYIPKETYFSDGGTEILSKIFSLNDFQTNSAVYLFSQNLEKSETMSRIGIFNEKSFEEAYFKQADFRSDNPILEYKKINPTKYKIRIHQAKNNFQLVFSDEFNPKWKMYLLKNKKILSWDNKNNLTKKIKEEKSNLSLNGLFDQASLFEINEFIKKDWLSVLDKKDDKFLFVSKNYYGSIQNESLPSGKFYETFIPNKDIFKQLPEINHLTVNGYANGWFLNVNELCKDEVFCELNSDGSYNFEVIIEFWQQKFFYYGVLLSIFSLVVVFCLSSKKKRK